MLKIDIIAVGRLKKGACFELIEEYKKRLSWTLNIYEVESRIKNPKDAQKDEIQKLTKHIKNDAYLILMDEHGKQFKSLDFSKKIEGLMHASCTNIQFIIGGADGLTEDLKSHGDLIMSLGKATWPHMLARAMLTEQLYRAQQIIAGHPYHRE